MTVRRAIPETEGVYFITFTCYNWLNLIEESDGFELVYRQFDLLLAEGYSIVGYVIMPNHVHFIIILNGKGKTPNKVMSSVKRFLAYDIVHALQRKGKIELLDILAKGVTPHEKLKGKIHAVFQPSFDCKECRTVKFVKQKLDYIHKNPCSKKWNLSPTPESYHYSSAGYYYDERKNRIDIRNYLEL